MFNFFAQVIADINTLLDSGIKSLGNGQTTYIIDNVLNLYTILLRAGNHSNENHGAVKELKKVKY